MSKMPVEDDKNVQSVWKPDLYRMQLEAPSPRPIFSKTPVQSVPWFNGAEYHGSISHLQALKILENEPEGAYLIRSSPCAQGLFYTLSLKFNSTIHHYKLYHENGTGFYVREKRYETVNELVADGLVSMYLKLKVPSLLQRLESTVSYQESPYMTLNKRKLKVLSRNSHNSVPFVPPTSKLVAPSSSNLKSPITISVPTSAPTIGGYAFGTGGEITPTQPFIPQYHKPHAFHLHTFKGLNWCELCGNFLWGFTQQGVKCEDCGFIAHVKCSSAVPSDCVPDLKKVRGVFGIDLTNTQISKDSGLPFVVIKCIEEIEVRGLLTEGIYRLSGFADEIDELKMALDTDGELANLSESQYSNINVIAGVLKLYLRLLPVPLITFSSYPKLINALKHKSLSDQLMEIKLVLINCLPIQHFNTLKYLIEHLKRVSQHQAINKMTPHNLATVFAPTLIGPPQFSDPASFDGPPDITTDIFLIELIISNCKQIF